MDLLGEWTWRRWQLVCLDPDVESLTVDLIELPEDAAAAPGALVTLLFRDSDLESSTGLREKLTTWMEHDDGLCDCFYRTSEPFGCLALFQRDDSVIVATTEVE